MTSLSRRRVLAAVSTACLALALAVAPATSATSFEGTARISVDPVSDVISGAGFTLGDPVSLYLNDAPVDTGGLTVSDGSNGGFWFEGGPDIVGGDVVRVEAGADVVSHTVFPLVVTTVGAAAVTGRSDVGTPNVQLSVDGSEFRAEALVTEPDGVWSIDVSGAQLQGGAGGVVWQSDIAGSQTQVSWSLPMVEADLGSRQVSGWGFGFPVSVTIAGQEFVGSPGDGNTPFDFYGDGWTLYDVAFQPGDLITASGPLTGDVPKELVVADLRMTGYDLTANTVSATSDQTAGVTIQVWHQGAEFSGGFLPATLVNGTWISDFDNADPPFDVRVADGFEVYQPDRDADATKVRGVLAGPRFTVGLEVQEVMGLDWPAGKTVTLTIDRPSTKVKPDFSAKATPGSQDQFGAWLMTGNGGDVYFDLTTSPFQVRAGDVMTMSNRTTTKTQVVPALTTGVPDRDSLTLSGTSSVPSDSFLLVASDAWWEGGAFHEVVVVDGSWSTSFMDDGVGFNTPFAYWTDPDGDMAESLAPRPGVWVDPDADRIWASDFGTVAGHRGVTLTVTRSGEVVKSMTVTSTNILTRGSWNLDMWMQRAGALPRPTVALYDLAGTFDVLAGDRLSVSDGVSTVVVDVADLTVDSIDAATDTVAGRAVLPDCEYASIGLHLGETEVGYWGYSTEPSGGVWSYHFDPAVFPNQGLEPGMTGQAMVHCASTIVRWTVADPYTMPSQLLPYVKSLRLKAAVTRSLTSLLQTAEQAYTASDDAGGNTSMAAFIAQVRSLAPGSIPEAPAHLLIADAEAIIAVHAT